jgi:hypothetical protein
MLNVRSLQRLDKNPIPQGVKECRATIIMRNEALRLPYLLAYYRGLGINRFFITDNGSTDGAREYVLNQPDCHVFLTEQSFAQSHFGAAWHEEILSMHGEGHWWMMADTDELLVYPDCETVKLKDFCAQLEAEGASGLYTAMIDMYPKGLIAHADCVPGKAFTEICPYFDTDYRFVARIAAPGKKQPFPPLEPIGGPRLRVFYPEFKRGGALAVIVTKISRKLHDALKKFGLNLNLPRAVPPMLFKVPLFKWHPGLKITSSHVVEPVVLSTQTGVLLHFKFFSDFHERAMKESARGEHFDGGGEYARYLAVLKANPNLGFYHDKSAAYAGSKQLISLGLMKANAPKRA